MCAHSQRTGVLGSAGTLPFRAHPCSQCGRPQAPSVLTVHPLLEPPLPSHDSAIPLHAYSSQAPPGHAETTLSSHPAAPQPPRLRPPRPVQTPPRRPPKSSSWALCRLPRASGKTALSSQHLWPTPGAGHFRGASNPTAARAEHPLQPLLLAPGAAFPPETPLSPLLPPMAPAANSMDSVAGGEGPAVSVPEGGTLPPPGWPQQLPAGSSQTLYLRWGAEPADQWPRRQRPCWAAGRSVPTWTPSQLPQRTLVPVCSEPRCREGLSSGSRITVCTACRPGPRPRPDRSWGGCDAPIPPSPSSDFIRVLGPPRLPWNCSCPGNPQSSVTDSFNKHYLS